MELFTLLLLEVALAQAQLTLTDSTITNGPILTGTFDPGTTLTGSITGGIPTFSIPATASNTAVDTSGPFTLTNAPAMASQAPCLKTCFDPSSLSNATDCSDVTNQCACFAPDNVLSQVSSCVDGCSASSASAATAATSLYSAYCAGLFGNAFLDQSGVAATSASASASITENATDSTDPPTILVTSTSTATANVPSWTTTSTNAAGGVRGDSGVFGVVVGLLLPALAL